MSFILRSLRHTTRLTRTSLIPRQSFLRYQTTMSVPTVKLNSGFDMPLVGFGLWKVNNDTCANQVYEAIKAGYRCFDGACGMNNSTDQPSHAIPDD